MKPRKRINPISDRQKERLKEYEKVKREWWKEVQGSYCRVALVVFGEKIKVGKSPHHVRGRLGALLCDTRYWLPVCQKSHDWIHSNIEEARRLGFIANKGDWNRP